MHYGELKKCDIANGAGVRVTLFVSGCTNHCPDCFQPQTWDFCYGREFTDATKAEIFAELDKPFISGLTVLGGEPFEPRNQRDLLPLLREYPDIEYVLVWRNAWDIPTHYFLPQPNTAEAEDFKNFINQL